MSFTVIAIMVAGICAVLAITCFAIADINKYGIFIVVLGGLLAAITVAAIVAAFGFYNHNAGESRKIGETQCVKEGGTVTEFKNYGICISDNGEMIREL